MSTTTDKKIRVFSITDEGKQIAFSDLDAIMIWIEEDIKGASEDDEFEYTVKVCYMTEKEFEELPEYDW